MRQVLLSPKASPTATDKTELSTFRSGRPSYCKHLETVGRCKTARCVTGGTTTAMIVLQGRGGDKPRVKRIPRTYISQSAVSPSLTGAIRWSGLLHGNKQQAHTQTHTHKHTHTHARTHAHKHTHTIQMETARLNTFYKRLSR